MTRMPTAAEDRARTPHGTADTVSDVRCEEAERDVVASALVNADCAAEFCERIRPAMDIVDPIYAAIGTEICKQHREHGEVVPVRVSRALAGHKAFDTIEPASLIAGLMTDLPTVAHFDGNVDLIIEMSQRRELRSIGEAIIAGASNCQMPTATMRVAKADLDDLASRQAAKQNLLSDMMPANEFCSADHRVEYLIPYCIPKGQPGIVSAKAKSLKTSIVLDANISMAAGVPFLDHWEVPRAMNCGIITAESGAATISETINRICVAKHITLNQISRLFVSTKCPKLRSPEWLTEIRRCIEAHELECLTIDPTYLALAGIDQNKLAAVAEALAPVSEIVNDTGCTILMVHHNRKVTPTPYGCPTLEEITGSGFAEWARFWLLLNRRREWDDELGQHWLWLVTGGSAGFGASRWLEVTEGKPTDLGGRVWRVGSIAASDGQSQEIETREAEQQHRTAAAIEADKEKIVRLLARHPSGKTKTFIRDHCGMSGRQFPRVFQAMYDAGELVDCDVQVGNKKTLQPGFKLNEEIT